MPDELRAVLEKMNRSELVQVARMAGLGNVSRDRPISVLVEEILVDETSGPDALEERRRMIEAHIQRHRARLLSQLPGCSGRCTTFGCPDIIVTRCWDGFSRDML